MRRGKAQRIRGTRRAICAAVSPPRSRLGWILMTHWQNSHVTFPSSWISVVLDRPQLRQCQFRTTVFMEARFLAEGRRRTRTKGGGTVGGIGRKESITRPAPPRAVPWAAFSRKSQRPGKTSARPVTKRVPGSARGAEERSGAASEAPEPGSLRSRGRDPPGCGGGESGSCPEWEARAPPSAFPPGGRRDASSSRTARPRRERPPPGPDRCASSLSFRRGQLLSLRARNR